MLPETTSMAGTVPPRVSIGLAVYNGERYLAGALDSLLAQTFTDFELIISNNASTDSTPEICKTYAARDARIRYTRTDTNIGGFRNHNRVVALARGEYFTWAAHDDLRAPGHLARCVEVLDRDPAVVLCFTGVRQIDEQGASLPDLPPYGRVTSMDPRERWFDLVLDEHWIYDPHYGVIRSADLRGTGLLSQHANADRVLLAELALRGRFYRIDSPLFMRRLHPESSRRLYATIQEYTAWFAPEGNDRVSYLRFRMLRSWILALRRAPVPWRLRLFCIRVVARWAVKYRQDMVHEISLAARNLARWAAGIPGPQREGVAS